MEVAVPGMPGSCIVLRWNNYVMSGRYFELLQPSKVDDDAWAKWMKIETSNESWITGMHWDGDWEQKNENTTL